MKSRRDLPREESRTESFKKEIMENMRTNVGKVKIRRDLPREKSRTQRIFQKSRKENYANEYWESENTPQFTARRITNEVNLLKKEIMRTKIGKVKRLRDLPQKESR